MHKNLEIYCLFLERNTLVPTTYNLVNKKRVNTRNKILRNSREISTFDDGINKGAVKRTINLMSNHSLRVTGK